MEGLPRRECGRLDRRTALPFRQSQQGGRYQTGRPGVGGAWHGMVAKVQGPGHEQQHRAVRRRADLAAGLGRSSGREQTQRASSMSCRAKWALRAGHGGRGRALGARDGPGMPPPSTDNRGEQTCVGPGAKRAAAHLRCGTRDLTDRGKNVRDDHGHHGQTFLLCAWWEAVKLTRTRRDGMSEMDEWYFVWDGWG